MGLIIPRMRIMHNFWGVFLEIESRSRLAFLDIFVKSAYDMFKKFSPQTKKRTKHYKDDAPSRTKSAYYYYSVQNMSLV